VALARLPPQELLAPLWIFQASCVEALLARAGPTNAAPRMGDRLGDVGCGEIGELLRVIPT